MHTHRRRGAHSRELVEAFSYLTNAHTLQCQILVEIERAGADSIPCEEHAKIVEPLVLALGLRSPWHVFPLMEEKRRIAILEMRYAGGLLGGD